MDYLWSSYDNDTFVHCSYVYTYCKMAQYRILQIVRGGKVLRMDKVRTSYPLENFHPVVRSPVKCAHMHMRFH